MIDPIINRAIIHQRSPLILPIGIAGSYVSCVTNPSWRGKRFPPVPVHSPAEVRMRLSLAVAALVVAGVAAPARADKKLDEAVTKAEAQLAKGKEDEAVKILQ